MCGDGVTIVWSKSDCSLEQLLLSVAHAGRAGAERSVLQGWYPKLGRGVSSIYHGKCMIGDNLWKDYCNITSKGIGKHQFKRAFWGTQVTYWYQIGPLKSACSRNWAPKCVRMEPTWTLHSAYALKAILYIGSIWYIHGSTANFGNSSQVLYTSVMFL